MAKIQDLLKGKDQVVDYDEVITKYPWIVEENKQCILSPDSDGLLCGLLMSKYLNWKVIGYYDGKVMLLKDGNSVYNNDTVFLDMEIYRKEVKSVGHHMLLLNKRHKPGSWDNYDNCLNPNNLRGYDGKNEFRLKYPLATIHLLLGILGHQNEIEIRKEAIAPLFFVDGTFKVLYSYPENVLNWLNYLGIKKDNSPLQKIFMHQHFSVYNQMLAMDEFYRKRDEISVEKQRGDKFVISDNIGNYMNIVREERSEYYKITDEKIKRVTKFIALLSETTGWEFKRENWEFDRLRRYKFTKGSFQSTGWTISNRDFYKFIEKMPLSWAMTSNQNIEFTLEEPDTLP
jgi:hypothetical protein